MHKQIRIHSVFLLTFFQIFAAAFALIEEEKEKAFKEFQERKERVRRRQLFDRQQKLKELGRSGLDQCVQDDAGS